MSDEWVTARVVPYLHDGVRLRVRLADSGIEVRLPDEATVEASGALGAPGGLRIQVRSADLERARNIVDASWDVRPDAVAHPDGPLATYAEWSRHQYDPGHYLGGTIEPDLRSSSRLGPRARFVAGLLLLSQGACGVGAAIGWAADEAWISALAVALSLLVLAAGWRRLSQTTPPPSGGVVEDDAQGVP